MRQSTDHRVSARDLAKAKAVAGSVRNASLRASAPLVLRLFSTTSGSGLRLASSGFSVAPGQDLERRAPCCLSLVGGTAEGRRRIGGGRATENAGGMGCQTTSGTAP